MTWKKYGGTCSVFPQQLAFIALHAFPLPCFGHNDHDVGSQRLAVTQHKEGVNFYVSDRLLS
jgi:hypothetical protein